jgi:hypothetical protein
MAEPAQNLDNPGAGAAAPANAEQGAAPETKPAEGKGKPAPRRQAEPSAPADPAVAREANIAKFARKMNAEAEKEGVEVDAPEAERRAKPGPKPGAKKTPKAVEMAPALADESAADAEPPAKPAKPQVRARRVIEAEPAAPGSEDSASDADESGDAITPDADADDGKPEPRATLQLKAKARLRHGDVDKAIRLAFGDLKPDEFDQIRETLTRKLEPNSKRWAEFRRHEAETKRTLEQRLAQLRQSAETLERTHAPLVQARKAMKEGRRAEAFKLAFGEDINDFQRAALREELSADAGTARMQNELATLKRELEEIKGGKVQPQEDPQREAQEQRAAESRGKDNIYKSLQQSEDADVRNFGRKAAFVNRVWEIRLQHFDAASRTTIPLQLAAEIARDETRAMLRSWSDEQEDPGSPAPNSELPALAGNEPVRPTSRGRVPNPSQAAGGGVSTKSMSTEQRIKVYTRLMGG